MLYSTIFFLRRYCITVMLTVVTLHPLAQILGQMFLTMFMVAYLARVRPYLSKVNNLQETINEILVLAASYPLLFFMSDD